MRHEQVREQLSTYIEGTLEQAMAAALEHHVRECADCARELAEMRKVYALLASPVLDVEPPPPFHDNVMRRVRLAQREAARTPRGFFARLGWGWTAASAAAVAAVLLAVVLAVGPLHEGVSAGFGLGRLFKPNAPATTLAMPSGEISVAFSESEPVPGQERPVSIRLRALQDGEWRLLAQPSPGLALLSTDATQANGALEAWRGVLATGQMADATLHLFPTVPGMVTELSLRLELADGRVAAEQTVFVPGSAGASAEPVEAWNPPARGTLRAALTEFARDSRRPVSAPSSALNAPVPVGAPNVEGQRTIQAIAGKVGLRVREAGGGFSLVP